MIYSLDFPSIQPATASSLLLSLTPALLSPVVKYTEEINEQTSAVKELNFDNDNVFWSPAGNKYHIFEDCQHIKGREGVTNGTVKESWDKKGISDLCKTCEKRAVKAKDISREDIEIPELELETAQ